MLIILKYLSTVWIQSWYVPSIIKHTNADRVLWGDPTCFSLAKMLQLRKNNFKIADVSAGLENFA